MTSTSSRSWFEALAIMTRRQVRLAFAPPARLLDDEARGEIEAEIEDGGRLTTTYGFMLFSACGIAALGLLQSSVAVIIGAMLISPLMGPIVAMGLAMARMQPRAFKSAAITLAIGALLSILASVLIVWISPLKNVTPEILARTQPTLLDLIVALLSGFVGAYLTINRKGGAIAGVAIATALMPPLAVVGFGIATASLPIAGGAMLLFLTNVVAILGAVFGVARRYGFHPGARKGAAWETLALIGAMVVLCIPLALSLSNIVTETTETVRARGVIEKAFAGQSPHITDLVVDASGRGPMAVECIVFTRRYVPGAADQIASQLPAGSKVSVEQVVTATGAPEGASAAAARPASGQPSLPGPKQRLRAMLSAAGQVVAIDEGADALTVDYVLNGAPTLADYRAVEQAAQRFTPETPLRIRPPLSPLPPVPFAGGSSRLDAEAERTVETIAWAVQRWAVASVDVEGLASPGSRGPRPADEAMARGRADAVAERLRALGVAVGATSGVVPATADGDPAALLAARVKPRA